MNPDKKRYYVLSSLFLCQICIGGSYAWSVFSKPLASTMGWELSDVTWAYSLLLTCLAFVGILGGKLLDKFGPRPLMFIAAVGWSLGWILTGFVTQVWQLYITFGLLCGFSGGLFYNPAITTAVRWFPDKKGLASGLVVGGAGLAPLVLAPIANSLLEKFGVFNAFKIIGLVFLVIVLLTAWLIKNPPAGWQPKGYNPPQVSATEASKWDKDWRGMMKDPLFYVLWICFLGASCSGIMMIGHSSGIGQELANMTAAQGALMVSIMAVANFGGRTLMGWLSDRIGRYKTLMIAMLVTVLDMAWLTTIHSFVPYVIALIVVGVCFGGTLAVFPTICSEVFGVKNMGLNYGIIFTAYGISSLIGPQFAAICSEKFQSYNNAFILSAVLALISFVLVVFISRKIAQRKKEA